MKGKKLCRWYDDKTSGIKRAYDSGLIDRKWVENYCWNSGEGCLRKKRFEQEGYVSPDYVLPDGSISEKVRSYLEQVSLFLLKNESGRRNRI